MAYRHKGSNWRARMAAWWLTSAIVCGPAVASDVRTQLPAHTQPLASIVAAQLPLASQARVGMYLLDLQQHQAWSLHNNPGYPLMSSFKLPLALWVLHQIEQGQLSLQTEVPITRAALLQHTWSPLLDEHIEPTFRLTISQLLRYSVQFSDNNAADLLLAQTGGTAALEAYLVSLGLTQTRISATEWQMHQGFSEQYRNHASPQDLALLLARFANGELLQPPHQQLLEQWLSDTPTGAARIKAALPAGSRWWHKTGTAGTDDSVSPALAVRPAVNDIGVVQLPDGRKFVVVMLVQDSRLSLAQTEQLMADLTAQLLRTVLTPSPSKVADHSAES